MAKQNQNYQFTDPWYDAFYEEQNPSIDYEPDYDYADYDPDEINQEEWTQQIEDDLETFKKTLALRKNESQKNQQQVAEFYQVINALPGNRLKEKFSLFLALTIIQQFNKSLYQSLQEAIAQEKPQTLAEILEAYYAQQQWEPPTSGTTSLTKFNIAPSYMHFLPKRPLVNIEKALSHLNHYYSPQSNTTQLYRNLVEFLSKHQDEFSLFNLDFDLKRFMHHLLDYFGYKAGDIVQDGCAGTGLLASEMLYPNSKMPTLQLESHDGVLAQIGQQLLQIKHHGKAPDNITFKLNHPLDGEISFKKGSADFYISCPQMPYKLSDSELNTAYRYTQVHYTGAIARYASDALWVQYALECLKPTGLAMIVVQDGFLHRSGYDAAVRKYLIDNRMIEAVISLHTTHARQSQYNQVSLLVLNNEPQDGEIYFFNLRDLPAGLGINFTENGVDNNWTRYPFLDADDKEDYWFFSEAKSVDFYQSVEKIRSNNYNLSFEYYKGQQHSSDYPKLENAEKAFEDAKAKMLNALKLFEDSLKS